MSGRIVNDLAPAEAPVHQFETGAVRGTDCRDCRLDLIPWRALKRWGETMAYGLRRYGPNNWRLGMPVEECANHALIHFYKYLNGDRSEDHMAHVLANVGFIIEFEETNPAMCDGLLGADGKLTDAQILTLQRHRERKERGSNGDA